MDWDSVLNEGDDLNEKWDNFKNILKNMESKYIPTKPKNNIKNENKFPIDENTRELINLKKKLAERIVHEKLEQTRLEYNKVRNNVKTQVKNMKKKNRKRCSHSQQTQP